jgi:hypothetical protein
VYHKTRRDAAAWWRSLRDVGRDSATARSRRSLPEHTSQTELKGFDPTVDRFSNGCRMT